jgi:hypothetical protein
MIATVNFKREYVELINTGTLTQDLSGWKLRAESSGEECLLEGELAPGQASRFWMLAADEERGGYNCGKESEIFNDNGDTAILYNAEGAEVARKAG